MGVSPQIRELREWIGKYADTPVTIFLEGETVEVWARTVNTSGNCTGPWTGPVEAIARTVPQTSIISTSNIPVNLPPRNNNDKL